MPQSLAPSALLIMKSRENKSSEQPDWYKRKGYPHFDRPISLAEAKSLVEDPEKVARHAFYPFIAYEKITPRFKRELGRVEDKIRPIAYSAHADSHIYSYYSYIISQLLEKRLQELGVSSCVTAYRKFPGGKSNVDFAKEVFDDVIRRSACDVVAMDVEGFFDKMSHAGLKSRWRSLLGVRELPPDHYAVFRAITKYSKISRDQLYNLLGIGRKRASTWHGPLCSSHQFRNDVKTSGLIQKHREPRGIPQGSPISATLSNLYMLDFDTHMHRWASERCYIYRRYSDDILVVCGSGEGAAVEEQIKAQLDSVKLKENDDKTEITRFRLNDEGQIQVENTKPLQYLGFIFDGRRILLRSQTVARYYRKMRKAVASAERAAKKHSKSRPVRIFRHDLYERFSHLGSRNMIAYAKRASQKMGSVGIRRQIRKHWESLNKTIEEAEE